MRHLETVGIQGVKEIVRGLPRNYVVKVELYKCATYALSGKSGENRAYGEEQLFAPLAVLLFLHFPAMCSHADVSRLTNQDGGSKARTFQEIRVLALQRTLAGGRDCVSLCSSGMHLRSGER